MTEKALRADRRTDHESQQEHPSHAHTSELYAERVEPLSDAGRGDEDDQCQGDQMSQGHIPSTGQ